MMTETFMSCALTLLILDAPPFPSVRAHEQRKHEADHAHHESAEKCRSEAADVKAEAQPF
jgi:hypothetical protein